ncbi:MAG: response regulator [Planctomycetota bacterium]
MIESVDYNILIADDDDGCRDSLECGLAERGFHTYTADSGRRAVEIVRTTPVDLLILDMFMRDLDGLTTYRLIKNVNRGIPCIFITSEPTKELLLEALDLGAATLIPKPLTLEIVVIEMDRILSDPHMRKHDHGQNIENHRD